MPEELTATKPPDHSKALTELEQSLYEEAQEVYQETGFDLTEYADLTVRSPASTW